MLLRCLVAKAVLFIPLLRLMMTKNTGETSVLLHAAVLIYVQHYLAITTPSPASWQQTLATALHSRVQAVQQQNLAPVVVPAHPGPAPLLPQVPTPCRLSQASALPQTHLNGIADKSSRHQRSSVPAQLLGAWQPEPAPPLLQASAHQAVSDIPLSSQTPQNGSGPSSTSYAAAVRARNPRGSSQAHVSYADVLAQPSEFPSKFSKRKVPEGNVVQEFDLPIKRHQNGFDASLSGLQEQSSQLHRLLEQSKADCSNV